MGFRSGGIALLPTGSPGQVQASGSTGHPHPTLPEAFQMMRRNRASFPGTPIILAGCASQPCPLVPDVFPLCLGVDFFPHWTPTRADTMRQTPLCACSGPTERFPHRVPAEWDTDATWLPLNNQWQQCAPGLRSTGPELGSGDRQWVLEAGGSHPQPLPVTSPGSRQRPRAVGTQPPPSAALVLTDRGRPENSGSMSSSAAEARA